MANNIAQIRGKHQISQTGLAKAIGVTKQCLSLAENDKCSVSLAKKISSYLNEDVIDILGSDVFVVAPKTDAEKEKFIEIIKNYKID